MIDSLQEEEIQAHYGGVLHQTQKQAFSNPVDGQNLSARRGGDFRDRNSEGDREGLLAHGPVGDASPNGDSLSQAGFCHWDEAQQ